MPDWTGERYLPWIKDAAIAYEHLHRYALAARLAEGKRVLDLASGEGYGANMLAAAALSVVGVEIDDVAVQHARKKYERENLEFVTGSVTHIPLREEHAFDLAVCFEAIEHVEDQEKLISEAKRMLKPGGLLIVSTPNKDVYRHESAEENPFHVRELEFEEFRSLLRQFFKNTGFLGQRIYANSTVWPIGNADDARIDEFVIARDSVEFEFATNDRRVPLYFIGLASDDALARFPGSVLIDCSDQLLKAKDYEVRQIEEALAWRERQLADRAATIASLEKAVAWHQTTIASHEQAIASLKRVVEELETDKVDLTARLRDATHQLGLIHCSRGWQLILRLRRIRDRLKALVTFRVPG
jgi:ubiquinone/menaquinone biosynthesis C-methylase UbiE